MITENLQTDMIRDRFLNLNRERVQRTKELMLQSQRDLLELIPLLFHVNNPDLPGYVDDSTPAGVFSFVIEDSLISGARKHWGALNIPKLGLWTVDIDAIFLMGSCGSIAFNRKSDFDVWVCYRSDIKDSKIKKLQKKADLIEKWFESVDLEVHFFLMNAITFKVGKVKKLSSESSGSAQHRILLDEFYRSSIWLAGKIPFWWFVPPEMEKCYNQVKDELTKNSIISEKEVIDFGELPDIPASEYFGAAVWQIYKGVDSPYKSILKITLMESYAGSHPRNLPLSSEFKQDIYQGIVEAGSLDPYVNMLYRIEQHLINIKETDRLEVIRRSFYLKLNFALSTGRETNNWRKESIEHLVSTWNWSNETIKHLDNQKNWRLEQVLQERKLLMMHLTKSYAYLSNFARKNAKERLINQKDLSILGRKLYSVFDRKPGKIEIFNRGIVDSIKEESITIMLLHGKDKRDHWRLYRGRITGDQFKKVKPLKHMFSLVELAAWMVFNQLLSNTTQKLLYAPGSEISSSEFNILLEILDKLNLDGDGEVAANKAFLLTPYVKKNMVFLNVGKAINVVGSNADRQLISEGVDVLNYGSKKECLIQTIEYSYVNSWKEIFVFKYYGADGIAQWVCDLLSEYMVASKHRRDVLEVSPEIHSFGSHLSYVLSSRFSKLIKSVLLAYISPKEKTTAYIYEAGDELYCIQSRHDKFNFVSFKNISELSDFFSESGENFQSVLFEEYALKGHVLKTVFARNKKSIIQLFLLPSKNNIDIYVIDEMGVLFQQKIPFDNVKMIARNFVDFITVIVEKNRLREDHAIDDSLESQLLPEIVEIYTLTKDQYHYKARLIELSDEYEKNFYGIQVIGDVVDQVTVFKFYCDDAEFNTAESGAKIFDVVAKHIFKKRSERKKYYVYITDLDLSPALLGDNVSDSVQIVKYLKYKKKIEGQLNKVLARL